MTEQIKQYFILKTQLKELRKDLSDSFKDDDQYVELYEDLKASREVLSSHKKNMIEASGQLKRKQDDIKRVADSIKTLSAAIKQNIVMTDKNTGEQLKMDFNI